MTKPKPERKTGIKWFMKTLAKGDPEAIEEAYKKEAARQVGEMEKWKARQERDDPQDMLFEFEDSLFPLIEKASKYKFLIYNRNKLVAKVQAKVVALKKHIETIDAYSGDGPKEMKAATDRLAEVEEELAVIIDEQIALAWRIRKIHIEVVTVSRGHLDAEKNEKDELSEFEYNYDIDLDAL